MPPKKKRKEGVSIKFDPNKKTTLPSDIPSQQSGGVRIAPEPKPKPKLPPTTPTHFGQGTPTTIETIGDFPKQNLSLEQQQQQAQILIQRQIEEERAEPVEPIEPQDRKMISLQEQLTAELETATPERKVAIESELRKLGTTPFFQRTTPETMERLQGEDFKQQLKIEEIGAEALAQEKVAGRGQQFISQIQQIEQLKQGAAFGASPAGGLISSPGFLAGTPQIRSNQWSHENSQDLLLGTLSGGAIGVVGALAAVSATGVGLPFALAGAAILTAIRGYQIYRSEIKELERADVMISDRYRQVTKEALRELIAQAHAGQEPQDILQSANEAVSMFRQSKARLTALTKTKAGATRSAGLDKLAEMDFFEEVQLNNYLAELQEAIVNPDFAKAALYYEMTGKLDINKLTSDIQVGLAAQETEGIF